MRPYLDYYGQHGISPVGQDIADLARHRRRRRALYRLLGIPSALVAGRAVIEFGPGSGHNAVYTVSLSPARYVLVDGNPKGLAETRALIDRHASADIEIAFVASEIGDVPQAADFDLVLAEGLLSFQPDAAGLLRHMAGFCRPGGVVVITTADAVSVLSETLRRLLSAWLVDADQSLDQQIDTLIPIWSPHLATLAGMSRPHGDWIADNLLQPFGRRWFSIPDAVTALADGYDVYGASPRFLTDWRWYKDITAADPGFNEIGCDHYRRNVHSLLDYRQTFRERDVDANATLLGAAHALFERTSMLSTGASVREVETVLELVPEVRRAIAGFAPDLAGAIDDYMRAAERLLRGQAPGDFGRFAPWFGRGQQYLSFVRREDIA